MWFQEPWWDEEMEAVLKETRESFHGTYKDAIKELLSLSRSEIDSITPGNADLEAYDRLITVVKQASRKNLSEKELRSSIETLGPVAEALARKAPHLSSLFD